MARSRYARNPLINRVREFGPLIISIDTKGNNLIQQNKVEFQAKKAPILEKSVSN